MAEGRAREGCVTINYEEEEDRLALIFHINVMSGKLRQAVR